MEVLNRKDREKRKVIEPDLRLNALSKVIVDCCFEVHNTLGPGLLESAYEECLFLLICERGLQVERQKFVDIKFRNHHVRNAYKIDLLVEGSIIVELKTVEKILPIHGAQMITYLKLSDCQLGLLINFNVKMLKDGVKRYVSSSLRS